MRILMCMLAATLAFGCKSKAEQQAQIGITPGSGSGSTAEAPGSGAGSGSGSATAGSGSDGPTVLVLPKLDAAEAKLPPHKTTGPLGQATFDKLSKLTYPGFKEEVRASTDKQLDIRYVTETRPRLAIVVRSWKCEAGKPEPAGCDPLTLDVWSKKKAEILADMKGGLAEDPGTVVEVGEVDLGGGAKGIYTYQLGFNVGKSEQGAGAYSDVYKIHWNDGVNRLQVAAEYKDDPTATVTDMTNLAPKEDLAKIARAYFDVYGRAWDQ